MPQPTPYDPGYSFTEWQVLNPDRPLPADKVDAEFDLLKQTIDEILDRMALIQRDDGEVANQTIGYDQLAPELDIGFNPPSQWAASTLYGTRDTVFFGVGFYRCTVQHVSTSFSNDLSAGKWVFIANLGGADGADGVDGADGTASGLKWNFDSSTSTNADPGVGDIRLNNGSFASVTQIAIDDQCAEVGNPDVSAWVLTWDDSTSTVKGLFVVRKTSAPENFAIYEVTGVTDQSGYSQLAVSYVVHSGSFANGDGLTVNFSAKGDKGDQGLSGAGTGDLLAANNLSELTGSAATARANIGLTIGTHVQAYNANLASLAGLTLAANKLPYATGANTLALTDLSAFARTILDDADAGTVRATLGLVIGTNVQAQSGILAALAGLSPGANQMAYFTGASSMSLANISAFGRSLINAAAASNARSTLELGSAATLNAGTGANNLVQLDSGGKLPAVDGSQLTGISGGGSSGAWVAMDEIVIGSGASACDIKDIPSFRAIRMTLVGVVMATASTTLNLRASDNNGSSYLGTNVYRIANEDSTISVGSTSAQADLLGTTVSSAVGGEIMFFGAIRFVTRILGFNTSNNYFCASRHGQINSAGINAYRLYPSSGNFTSGVVFVEYIPA